MTKRTTFTREIDVASRLARQAGRITMEIYATDFAVVFKGPNDPAARARFQHDLVEFMRTRYGALLAQIAQKKQITDDARVELKRAIGEFKERFQTTAATARA